MKSATTEAKKIRSTDEMLVFTAVAADPSGADVAGGGGLVVAGVFGGGAVVTEGAGALPGGKLVGVRSTEPVVQRKIGQNGFPQEVPMLPSNCFRRSQQCFTDSQTTSTMGHGLACIHSTA